MWIKNGYQGYKTTFFPLSSRGGKKKITHWYKCIKMCKSKSQILFKCTGYLVTFHMQVTGSSSQVGMDRRKQEINTRSRCLEANKCPSYYLKNLGLHLRVSCRTIQDISHSVPAEVSTVSHYKQR